MIKKMQRAVKEAVPYLWRREHCIPVWQTHLEKKKGRESCHEPWHCWQRDGATEMPFPGPQNRLVPASPLSPRDASWDGAAPVPALSGGSGSKAEPLAQAAPAGLLASAAKGCSDTSSQHTGLRWAQRALSLPPWHSSQDSRGTRSSRSAWKHRQGHTAGPEMNTGRPAWMALSQSLCPPRAQGRAGVAVPGWGSCRSPQLPCPSTCPLPSLAATGTAGTHLSRSSHRPSPGLASGPARGCPAPP